MTHFHRARRSTLLWLALAGLALLTAGAVQQRQAFLTRGLPDGLPQPVAHSGVSLGVNVALEQYSEAALHEQLAQIAAMGIKYVKQSFYFREDFDWAESDRLVTAVAQHNLTLVPLLDGDPANDFAPPSPLADYAAWTAEFARRYGDQIDTYIIWDEPNLAAHWGNQPVNAGEYGALLSLAAAAIRQADSDAVVAAAPLAPTVETGPMNLADPTYLQLLYESGASDAFDVVMGKPYGFNNPPDDREVDMNHLNFSRIILLREVMQRNGDGGKAIWGGNWGWNHLPADWDGAPSIWGEVTAVQQTEYTVNALERARKEWPWIGVMFLENWEPAAPANDPRRGFSIAGSETAVALADYLAAQDPAVVPPGFHLARADDPAQIYEGGWEFSPEFGADISQQPENVRLGDRVTFTFWGTDLGLRVRRANFRARLYVTVDGQPANALPSDEYGATLILTSPAKSDDYVAIEPVARNLTPGVHTAEIVASRGWDQWALNGFSVAYRPPQANVKALLWVLWLLSGAAFLLAIRSFSRANWFGWWRQQRVRFQALGRGWQIGSTAVTAVLVALSGWFTWAENMGGIYRRLDDGGQIALTAAAASIYYVTPTFFVYAAALLVLFVLLTWRPVWGLALIAFCFPFSVESVLKPVFQYRFSPVEVFTLITFAAFGLHQAAQATAVFKSKLEAGAWPRLHPHLTCTDKAVILFTAVATLSLLFTERLDVATNEWRLVILEPVLFYWMLRGLNPKAKEMWLIWDAFILGGLAVGLYGLWQYLFSPEQLITAEGGLRRIQSFYGSPNNVALYLGRNLPLLGAMTLLGSRQQHGWRWWAYTAVLPLLGLVTLLTFSKGALFLGLPGAFLVIFWQWQRQNGRRTWPWLIAFVLAGAGGLLAIQQIPQLAERLSLTGETGVFRLNLWRASLNMIVDQPLFGVGLDNFLYAYRGRYIFDAAWRDPNLSHPHNILLDFGARLGLLGLVTGLYLIWQPARLLNQVWPQVKPLWRPLVVGLAASLTNMLLHGLVDHSFFLVDLAFAFYLMLGTAAWLRHGATRTS